MRKLSRWALIGAIGMSGSLPLLAAILPADRADALFHAYKGGGVEITGPSLMVRKAFGADVSLFGNYYVDSITSASIDVITSASPYTEERREQSAGATYLLNKTNMSLAYTHSKENDFTADSAHANISQDVFGDLTTISMGFSRGWDTVGRTGDTAFKRDADRRQYRLGLSQIVTKNLLMDAGFETITDEGFLNNPYRSVRYIDPDNTSNYLRQPEVYPRTRTSHAASLRALYYLPYRATLSGEYRFFTDTWGIKANTFELGYTHPRPDGWTYEASYRYYTQTKADFYSDLFSYPDAQNYLARDKELSTFNSHSIGLGVSYEFPKQLWSFIDKSSVNLRYNHILFDYADFRDLRVEGVPPGEEPLYNFSADVLQLYFSAWY